MIQRIRSYHSIAQMLNSTPKEVRETERTAISKLQHIMGCSRKKLLRALGQLDKVQRPIGTEKDSC